MAVDDSYTKTLLHFDGADASTTFTDESGRSWTAAGTAQIDTAQSVFGGASGLFNGSSNNIYAADHADWRFDDGSNSNLWTIDFRVRFSSTSATQVFFRQYVDGDNYRGVQWTSADGLWLFNYEGGSDNLGIKKSWTPSNNTWYHVAIVKNGTSGYMFFINGTQIGSTETDTSTMSDFAASFYLGYSVTGWMDEFRLSKGVARWTANFTPPTAQYGAQNYISGISGAGTPAGAIAKMPARALSAGSTPAGAIIRKTSRAFSAGGTPAGVVNKTLARALSGAATMAGVIRFGFFEVLAGAVSTITSAVTWVRTLATPLTAAISSASQLIIRLNDVIQLIFAGSASSSASLLVSEKFWITPRSHRLHTRETKYAMTARKRDYRLTTRGRGDY